MTEPTPTPEIDELLAYRGWVRRLCRQLVRNEAEAEDVEQETWRRVLESPPRHRSNLKGWLATVVRSAAIKRGRHASASRAGEESLRQKARADANPDEAGADRGNGPDATAEQRETFALLHRLLTDLEEPYGEVVFLRYVKGVPPRRIAKRLGLPVATVKTRLKRGLEILRRRTRKQLGPTWRDRCMVFVPSLPSVVATTLTTITISKPIKLTLAAAALALAIPLYSMLSVDEGDSVVHSPSAATLAPVERPELLSAGSGSAAIRGKIEPGDSVAAIPAPTGPKLRIVVKDRMTMEPVPRVVVYALDIAHPNLDQGKYEIENRTRFQSEGLLREFGQRFESNERGEVEIPGAYGARVDVCAVTPSEYDFGSLSRFEGEDEAVLELYLRQRIDRAVDVLDSESQPIGDVQVAWVIKGTEGWGERSVMLARTDASGRALFQNLQVRGSGFRGGQAGHGMQARYGGEVRVLQEFDPLELDPAPIRLHLPQGVPLRVNVAEELHDVCADGYPVMLFAAPPGEDRTHFLDTGGRWRNRLASASFLDREARFPVVTPGFQGYVLVFAGVANECILQRVEIPVDADREQRVTVRVPSDDDAIVVRFLGADAALFGAIDWAVDLYELRDVKDGHHRLQVKAGVEATHKFREAPGFVRDSPLERDYKLRYVSTSDPSDIWFGSLDFDAALFDAKERVLGVEVSGDLVVSGRVIDQAGNPVEAASVMLRGSWFRHAFGNKVNQQIVSAVTGEDGRFRIRGKAGSVTSLDIRVRNNSYKKLEFVPGVPDQVFPVTVPPELRGYFLSDPSIPPGALNAPLEPVGEVESMGGVFINPATGKFTSSYHSPGTFVLLVEDSFEQEIFRSNALDLQAGVVEPESLNPLDLRGMLHAHSIRVLGLEGEEVPRFTLREINRGWQRDRVRSGETLVTMVDSLRLVVDAPGFATSEPFLLSGEATVPLTAPVAVRIELPSGVSLQNDKFSWVVRFESTNVHDPTWKIEREEYLDAGGQAFALPAGGDWKVHLNAYEHRERERQLIWEDWLRFQLPVNAFGGEGLSISIPEGVSEWSFVLPISQELLDQVRRD
jgi:RNA polymerase sigma factor (sigma-70 family)